VDSPNEPLPGREAAGPLAPSGSNGAELRNCSAYVCEWIAGEKADTNCFGSNVHPTAS
jgi:hypothetical protein